MDLRLTALISAYQAAIADALRLLEQAGIPRPNSNTAWAINATPPPLDVGYSLSFSWHQLWLWRCRWPWRL